jgi:hypothetical protein
MLEAEPAVSPVAVSVPADEAVFRSVGTALKTQTKSPLVMPGSSGYVTDQAVVDAVLATAVAAISQDVPAAFVNVKANACPAAGVAQVIDTVVPSSSPTASFVQTNKRMDPASLAEAVVPCEMYPRFVNPVTVG